MRRSLAPAHAAPTRHASAAPLRREALRTHHSLAAPFTSGPARAARLTIAARPVPFAPSPARAVQRRYTTGAAPPNPPQGAQQPGASEQPAPPPQQQHAPPPPQLYYDLSLGPLDPAVPEEAAIIEELNDPTRPKNPHVTFKRLLERMRTGQLRPNAPDEVKGAYMYVVTYVPEELQKLALKAMTAKADGRLDEYKQLETEFNARAQALPPPTFWSRFGAFWRHTFNQRDRHLLWDQILIQEDMCDPVRREEILAGKHTSWVRSMLVGSNKPPAQPQAPAETQSQAHGQTQAQTQTAASAADVLKAEAQSSARETSKDKAAEATKKL